MKTVRVLLACAVISSISSAVMAAGICIQKTSDGCEDLNTGRVYVRSGDELVDPETKHPVMRIEPFRPHVVTEQDRRDTLRRKAEAIEEAKAAAEWQRVEAENQRVWAAQAAAEAQAQALQSVLQQSHEQARAIKRMQDDIEFLEAVMPIR